MRSILPRLLAPAVGLAGLALFAALYVWRPDWYFVALTGMGLKPWRYPFLDGEYVLATVECARKGIDIYLGNPCDVLNRVNPYPPLWMSLTFLPTGKAWTNPLGLGLAAAFFASLAALPPPRRLAEGAAVVLATLSSAVCYAIERANVDSAIFVMVVVAGLVLLRPARLRLLAYPLMLLAALLKLYPMVLFAVTLRERPRIFAAVNAVAFAVAAAALLWWLPQLSEMWPNVPRNFVRDAYGADLWPTLNACSIVGGIDDCSVMPARPGVALELVYLGLWAFCLCFAALIACAVRRTPGLDEALDRLGAGEDAFLVLGALVVVGCFFAGRNVDYRQVFLLLTLPAWFQLSRPGPADGVRRLARLVVALMILLMWNEAIHRLWDAVGLNGTALFELRELAYWTVISILAAVLWQRLSAGPMAAWLLQSVAALGWAGRPRHG